MVRKKSDAARTDPMTEHFTLAEKLERLFQSVRSPAGREYTYAEAATGINARGIATISAAYLCDLRNGMKDNPRVKLIEALADFFGVPVTYFLDMDPLAARLYGQLVAMPTYDDPESQKLLTFLADLSPEARHAVVQIAEQAMQLERLDKRRKSRS